jgi:putative tricarboxylic transport membrane protein
MQIERQKQPGETVFGFLMLAMSLFLLWTAYGIAGLSSLSSPGAFPLAASAVMVLASAVTVVKNARLPAEQGGAFFTQVMPTIVGVFCGLVAVFAVLMESAGFLVSAFIFLLSSIWFLHRRGPLRALLLTLLSITVVYVVFRLIFQVVLPEGIVPEREILAAIGNLFRGTN